MSALHDLKCACDAGARVGVDGEGLTLNAEGAPFPPLLELLSRYKTEVVELLRCESDTWSSEDWQALFDERAAIAEVDAQMSRDDAEAQALAFCVAEWIARNPKRSSPRLRPHCAEDSQACGNFSSATLEHCVHTRTPSRPYDELPQDRNRSDRGAIKL